MYVQQGEKMTLQMLMEYNEDNPGDGFVLLQTDDPVIRLFNSYQIWFDWEKKHGYDKYV